jgi:hypothetical protein
MGSYGEFVDTAMWSIRSSGHEERKRKSFSSESSMEEMHLVNIMGGYFVQGLGARLYASS